MTRARTKAQREILRLQRAYQQAHMAEHCAENMLDVARDALVRIVAEVEDQAAIEVSRAMFAAWTVAAQQCHVAHEAAAAAFYALIDRKRAQRGKRARRKAH
jgi:hypothetical protein